MGKISTSLYDEEHCHQLAVLIPTVLAVSHVSTKWGPIEEQEDCKQMGPMLRNPTVSGTNLEGQAGGLV